MTNEDTAGIVIGPNGTWLQERTKEGPEITDVWVGKGFESSEVVLANAEGWSTGDSREPSVYVVGGTIAREALATLLVSDKVRTDRRAGL